MGWRAKQNNHPKISSHVNAAVFILKQRQNTSANMAQAEHQQGRDHGVKNTVATVEDGDLADKNMQEGVGRPIAAKHHSVDSVPFSKMPSLTCS